MIQFVSLLLLAAPAEIVLEVKPPGVRTVLSTVGNGPTLAGTVEGSRVSFTGVPPGRYVLTALLEGYAAVQQITLDEAFEQAVQIALKTLDEDVHGDG